MSNLDDGSRARKIAKLRFIFANLLYLLGKFDINIGTVVYLPLGKVGNLK